MVWNKEAECMSKEEKEKLQLERLQQTVKLAYNNVSFYKEKFDEAGITPEDIKTLKDIEKIKQIFLFAMQTEKKKVPIMNFEMDYTGERGNVPRITFDSEFLDNLYKPSDAPLMKELEMKEDLNDGNAKH